MSRCFAGFDTARFVAWEFRPTLACLFATLVGLLQGLLGRLKWPTLLQFGAGPRLIAFPIRHPRPHRGARRFLPHQIGVEGFLRRLQHHHIPHAVLRGLIRCRKIRRARISICWSMTHIWNRFAKFWQTELAYSRSICIRFPDAPVPIFAACLTIHRRAPTSCWTVRSCITICAESPQCENTFSASRTTPFITKDLRRGWPITPTQCRRAKKPITIIIPSWHPWPRGWDWSCQLR